MKAMTMEIIAKIEELLKFILQLRMENNIL